VANVEEENVNSGNQFSETLENAVSNENAQVVRVCAALEAQIAEFDDEDDKALFLEEYGLEESGLNRLIKAAYALLDLITYFTAGVQEVRAWTIKRGWKAPQAAGVIHTDFERGFIKAEVIKLDNYQKYESEAACKEAGKLAIEGKEYVVEDGDIMHFRFNV
jgi:ribosome-binding ATPase YchF (GTP1/OBG family)